MLVGFTGFHESLMETTLILKNIDLTALTGVVQLLGWCSVEGKVTSSSPSQGTCLGCGLGPLLQHVQEATDGCFSLPVFLPPLSSS